MLTRFRCDMKIKDNPVEVYTSFRAFWPYYLSEHAEPVNRYIHVIGTTLALVLSGYAVLAGSYNLLWGAPLVGYGGAWIGHFFIEKNRPATFRYPIYSLLGDFKMCALIYTGQLNNELMKHNIRASSRS